MYPDTNTGMARPFVPFVCTSIWCTIGSNNKEPRTERVFLHYSTQGARHVNIHF